VSRCDQGFVTVRVRMHVVVLWFAYVGGRRWEQKAEGKRSKGTQFASMIVGGEGEDCDNGLGRGRQKVGKQRATSCR
jgi:hypothetical protein